MVLVFLTWTYKSANSSTLTNNLDITKTLIELEKSISNIVVINQRKTNLVQTLPYLEEKTLRNRLTYDPLPINEKPYYQELERRFEIILLVSVPATYMISKFLMEQVSFYNYKDNSRTMNYQQWVYIIANSLIIPILTASEDYLKYKKFLEKEIK